MTFDGGELAGLLDELGADPWERQQLIEVLGEVAGEGLPYGGDDDYGPWDDHSDLAQLHAAGEALDFAYQRDARRRAEDASGGLGKRPKDEDKLAHAFARIQQGTYLPPAQLRTDLASTRERQPARRGPGRARPRSAARARRRWHHEGALIFGEVLGLSHRCPGPARRRTPRGRRPGARGGPPARV